ncbi:MAG: 30S ribosomal protein S1, partial [Cyclobacteriaceae bacterium]
MAEQKTKEGFDWDQADQRGFGEEYTAEERANMASMYDDTLTQVNENEVVKGTVVGINDRDVILNIGFKSDGLISA